MKIVVETIYSSDIVFFVDEEMSECHKLLKNKKDREMVKKELKDSNPENAVTMFHLFDNGRCDARRQFVFLGKSSQNPQFFGRVAHEIFHVVNNIERMVHLQDDWAGNEHLAYLYGDVHEQFWAQLLGYKKLKSKI